MMKNEDQTKLKNLLNFNLFNRILFCFLIFHFSFAGMLRASDHTGKIIYTFPSRGANYILPECEIIIRFDEYPDILTNSKEMKDI